MKVFFVLCFLIFIQTNILRSSDKLIEITKKELKNFDGKNGKPAYVAIKGIIYDVTKLWESGIHKDKLAAGMDLTKELYSKAPHKDDKLKKLTIVGKLID